MTSVEKRSLTNPTMKPREWLLLVILAVLWGGSFFFIKVTVQELPTLTIVLGRVSIAAIVLTAFVYLSGQTLPASPKQWGEFLIMGALSNFIPFSLIVWGETQISSSLASILNATTPVFTVVLAHFLTSQERLTPNRLAGVLCGVCGVVVLVGGNTFNGLQSHFLGQLAVIGAAISYSFSGIYGQRFKRLPFSVAAAGMLIGTAVIMLPLTAILEQPWTLRPSVTASSALLALGLFSTAIAYLIYFHLLAVAGATNTALVTFLIPISAVLLGTFILNEQLQWNTFAGMVLIFTGLAAIDGRLLRRS
jgi:drug/metabolite transporter (DMT)-like permease